MGPLVSVGALGGSILLGRLSGAILEVAVDNRQVGDRNRGKQGLKMYSKSLNRSSLWVAMHSRPGVLGQVAHQEEKLGGKMLM